MQIVEIPSFRHYGIVYRYELSDSQFCKYNQIVKDSGLTAKTVHQLFISGCLTKEVKQI